MPELMSLNALATSAQYQKHTEFWKAALGRIEEDFHLRQNWQSYALPYGASPDYSFEIDGAAGEALRKLSHDKDLQAFVILLAATFHVLKSYSGLSSLFVDSPRLATKSPSPDGACIPLASPQHEAVTVRDYLNQVREIVQGSFSYQDFPVADFAEKLLKRRPVTNVLLRFESLHEVPSASAHHDLLITIRRRDGFEIALQGNSRVFTHHYLQHFARHLQNAVAAFRQLDSPLASISLMDDEEKRRRPAVESIPVEQTVLDGLAQRARSSPDSIAIATAEGELTYGELDEQSSRLARFLSTEYGVQRGDRIGVLSDRSERWIIGILGILKAGAVYVPLDPEYPRERLHFMIEDASIRALLVHSEYLHQLTDSWAISMFALDFQLATLEPLAEPWSIGVRPEDAAYIIYTSGSTGTPKGVVLEHRGLMNMAQYHVDAFGFDPSDRFVQFYSPGFDGSIMEIFVTLLAGARLVLARPDVIKNVEEFSAFISQQGVTTLNAAPAYLNTLDWNALRSIKRIISAGDSARVSDASELSKTRTYHNSYGPTEATVCITDYVVDPNVRYGSRIPVGKPIRNVRIDLLDENCEPVAEGCVGEICVSGIALARGYLNRDELTAAAFIPHPFEPGERLYRTGDLGVWLPDGNLEIIGRRDGQVKLRGYRIELGEIEAALLQHHGVSAAVVLLREDTAERKRLVAYVSPAKVIAADLREHLKSRLPDFMIPATFVAIEQMPQTPAGKVDRKALGALALESNTAHTPYIAPTNEIEQRLGEIWADLLGRDKIGVHDNFFELGGDSILIIQTVSRAHQAGIKLTAQQHFEHPTIAGLAKVAVDVSSVRVAQGPVVGRAELSPIQQWFFAQKVEDPHHYNQSFRIAVPASLEAQVIAQALTHIIEHHDALRLAFFRVGDSWEQLHSPPPLAITVDSTSLAGAPSGTREDSILSVATRLQKSFDLSAAPLLRAHLFHFGPDQTSCLLLIAHHLVIDGVSWRILLEDLYTVCQQIEAAESVRLPDKTTSFREWSRRLNELSASVEGVDYWVRKAAETHVAFENIPLGTIETADTINLQLDEQQTRALLQDVPRSHNAQIQEVLLTALLLAFRDWTGDTALLVELEGHGREEIFDDVDLSRTIGWFTAHYPVLLSGGDVATSPGEALSAVKEQLREVPLRGLGYGIARYLRQELLLERQPPAPVRFNYMGQIDRVLHDASGWKPLVGFNGAEHSARARRSHLFEIEGLIFEGRLQLAWTYNRSAHERAAIEQLAGLYRSHLLRLIQMSGASFQSFSPSDFPAARIDSEALSTLVQRIQS